MWLLQIYHKQQYFSILQYQQSFSHQNFRKLQHITRGIFDQLWYLPQTIRGKQSKKI